MFSGPDGKSFEPYKIKSRKKELVHNGDVEMGVTEQEGEEEVELIEDPEDNEGAIWPLKRRIYGSVEWLLLIKRQRVE